MWWTWRIKRKWSPLIISNQTPTTPSAWHLYATQQRYNHTCLYFSTRTPNPDDWCLHPPRPPTTSWPLLAASLECWLFSGLSTTVCEDDAVRKRKRNQFVWRRPFWNMRYGPEVAAAVANDPTAIQKLHEQSHHQHHHGKLPMSSSSSSAMLGHGSANTSSSRLSSIPQVEKMATAFSEAMATKGNYMDIRTSLGRRRKGERWSCGTWYSGGRPQGGWWKWPGWWFRWWWPWISIWDFNNCDGGRQGQPDN